MARKLIVEVVLDAAAYSRQIKKAEAQTVGFASNLQKTGRETVAASANLKGLGRSVAFATGGFVAFHSAADFVRESVDAAREAVVAQRSLAAQMKASGESFAANRDRIEEVAQSYARFGFQNDEVIQSLTVLERGTGRINDALELQGLTADIARAKNIDLAAAANVVAKVFGGQETALRRAVPGLERNAHGWDLIREAQQKLAGQAAANTTASERFAATLHDTQEIIGTALLPSLNKLLDSMTKYLTKLQQSGKLQKDVTTAAGAAGDAFTVLAGSLELATEAYGKWRDVTGASGSKPGFLSNLFGGTLRQQLDDFISRAKYLGGAAQKYAEALGIIGKANAKVVAPAGVRGPLGGGGGAAIGAPSGVLGPDLGGGPQRATVQQRNTWFDQTIGRGLLRAGLLTGLDAQIAAYKQIQEKLKQRFAITKDATRRLKLEDDMLQNAATITGLQAEKADKVKQATEEAAQKAKDAADAARAETLAWSDFAVERAGATVSLKDDLQRARERLAVVTAQAQIGKMTAEKAVQVWEAQQAVKAAVKAIADSAGKMADDAKRRKVSALDRKIDWAELTLEKADATKSLDDNIAAQKTIIGLIKQHIQLVGRTAEDARRLWEAQQKLRDFINQKRGQQRPKRDSNAPFMEIFDPAIWASVKGQLGPGGTLNGVPVRFVGPSQTDRLNARLDRMAPLVPITINGGLHLHGIQNPKQMEEALTKRSQSRPQPRRGPV